MERCSLCILPRNYSAVEFGPGGVCSLCRDRDAAARTEAAERERLRAELERIVAGLREGPGDYQCIVPISGGLDSSYVAYVIRRRFGLRALGVNFDNGYRTPLALENIERLSRRLEMDVVTLGLHPGLWRRMFAHHFRQCGYFCKVCNAVGHILVGSFAAREARRRGIASVVFGGWSRKYEYQPGLSVLSMSAFGRVLGRDPGLFRELRGNPLVEPSVMDALLEADDVRRAAGDNAEGRAVDRAGFRLFHLPNAMDWNYSEIVPTLEKEVGWRRRERGHEAHFDCVLAPVQEYLKHRKFGFSQETIKNSVLIREGRMSREEALRRQDLEQTDEPAVLQQVLAEWGMGREDVPWDADWQ